MPQPSDYSSFNSRAIVLSLGFNLRSLNKEYCMSLIENESSLSWNDFVSLQKSDLIRIQFSHSKCNWLMQSENAPRSWKLWLAALTYLTIILILGSALLLIVVRWWIPMSLLCFCLVLTWLIRYLAAKAVLSSSLKNESFYNMALLRGALIIYRQTETQDED